MSDAADHRARRVRGTALGGECCVKIMNRVSERSEYSGKLTVPRVSIQEQSGEVGFGVAHFWDVERMTPAGGCPCLCRHPTCCSEPSVGIVSDTKPQSMCTPYRIMHAYIGYRKLLDAGNNLRKSSKASENNGHSLNASLSSHISEYRNRAFGEVPGPRLCRPSSGIRLFSR